MALHGFVDDALAVARVFSERQSCLCCWDLGPLCLRYTRFPRDTNV